MQKKLLTPTLFIASLLFASSNGFAQTGGLIAHWDFNGGTSDVTGNGNDGTPHNVVAVAGESGLPNTAYYFNGGTSPSSYSWIEVGNQADLNLTRYSICATINVTSFYSGTCQVNKLFERGQEASSDNYFLSFGDNDYDGGDCFPYYPANDVFVAGAGTYLPPIGSWHYTPHIQPNVWTCVVATYDGTNERIYVDGVLKSTVPCTATISSGTDGISIGKAFGSSISYPYPFNGIIDDIRLYNRALQPGEIPEYCNSVTQDGPDASHRGIQPIGSATQTAPSIDIYPNPAKDIISIQGSDLSGNIHITISNTLGQTVKSIMLDNDHRQMSVADLPPAVYLLQVQTESGVTSSKKFVKQ